MDNKSKLRWCSIIYSIFLSAIIVIVFYFQSYDKYFRWVFQNQMKNH